MQLLPRSQQELKKLVDRYLCLLHRRQLEGDRQDDVQCIELRVIFRRDYVTLQ